MIPAVTTVRLTGAHNRAELPLLVLGPSLGTSATALWSASASGLTDAFDVVAWDLPGHGHNRWVHDEPFTMAELAAGVLRVVDTVLEERGELGGPFAYAGNSVGGAVGLQLMLDVPRRVTAAVLLCTGARIDDSALLHTLDRAEGTDYVQVCAALSEFDVRNRLGEIGAPVLAVAGADDVVTPPDTVREIADGVQDGRLVELDGVAHLAPAEVPDVVTRLLRHHLLGEPLGEDEQQDRTLREVYDAGMAVRREVLGDAHVERATATSTDLTADFQQLITTYAWGSIWTRPGLDRRSRSLVALTALVARGHHEELAVHLRAARTNGVTAEEIKELLLQTAIYCGVPDANAAFRVAQQVMAEEGHR
ncbi:4-carboxymuconolactone decarboxylase [Nocardioides sp. LHG3406-4]|uniref:4-carboxymuconolactone decarboxylase n=1 Tax=Nocardioides sp. LHG3406-4 TaxID=2804575 RepID=UPI003CE934B3